MTGVVDDHPGFLVLAHAMLVRIGRVAMVVEDVLAEPLEVPVVVLCFRPRSSWRSSSSSQCLVGCLLLG